MCHYYYFIRRLHLHFSDKHYFRVHIVTQSDWRRVGVVENLIVRFTET